METNGNMERLQRSYAELVELQLVLERAGAFFDSKKGGKFEIVSESFGDFNDGESPLLEAVVSLGPDGLQGELGLCMHRCPCACVEACPSRKVCRSQTIRQSGGCWAAL